LEGIREEGTMFYRCVVFLWIILFPALMVAAQDEDKNNKSDAKELSGMSIVGNDEAPKSLYIVPWKSSEIGVETSLHSMLNESDGPVDRDVFKRQLEFYQIRTGK